MTRSPKRILAFGHVAGGVQRAGDLLDPARTELVKTPGKSGGLRPYLQRLAARPDLVYLVDAARSTLVAAAAARARGVPFVIDTGDVGHALARSMGRSALEVEAIRRAEGWLQRKSILTVVRGTGHLNHVPGRKVVVQDVAPAAARPLDRDACRRAIGVRSEFVVGLVGTLDVARGVGLVYGWDLVEALPDARSDIVGVIVGDGDGLEELRRRAVELGVEGRCTFLGRLDGDDVVEAVNAFDVALSTQTNDLVGRVRTTGKLPLYLACGCPVIATEVGEAARVLPPEWTLPYEGVVDHTYPRRLAARLNEVAGAGGPSARHLALELSGRYFARDRLAGRLQEAVDDAFAEALP